MAKSGIISELQKRLSFTPDFPELRMNSKVLLFIYDEFKQSHVRNIYLKKYGSNYLGKARTITPYYKMKILQKECTPIVFETKKDDVGKAHITGELYAVTPDFILEMDEYLGNGITMHRKRRQVLALSQDMEFNKRLSKPAFMYIADEDYWKDIKTFPQHRVIDNVLGKALYTWG